MKMLKKFVKFSVLTMLAGSVFCGSALAGQGAESTETGQSLKMLWRQHGGNVEPKTEPSSESERIDSSYFMHLWQNGGGAVSEEPADDKVGDRTIPVKKRGRSIALLVGMENYRDRSIRDLPEIRLDFDAIGGVLERRFGFEILTVIDPGVAEIRAAMTRLSAELGPDDQLLVYFSGHGWLHPQTGVGYWLLQNADADDPMTYWDTSEMLLLVEDQKAGDVLLISNSCFAGALARDRKGIRRFYATDNPLNRNRGYGKTRAYMAAGGAELVYGRGADKLTVLGWAVMQELDQVSEIVSARALFSNISRRLTQDANQTPIYAELLSLGHDAGSDFLFYPRSVKE